MTAIYPSHHWRLMYHRVPVELKKICELCQAYSSAMEHYQDVAPSLTGNDVAYVQALVNQILAEYIRLIRSVEKLDKDGLKAINDDIRSNMTAFLDKDGRVFPLTTTFSAAREKGLIDMHFPLFFASATAFINSRIYDSLAEAHTTSQIEFLNTFVQSGVKKAGFIPSFEKEEMHGLRKFGRSKQEDDEL